MVVTGVGLGVNYWLLVSWAYGQECVSEKETRKKVIKWTVKCLYIAPSPFSQVDMKEQKNMAQKKWHSHLSVLWKKKLIKLKGPLVVLGNKFPLFLLLSNYNDRRIA